MEQIRQNYYGNLCTEMYEILHSEAPSDELDFYLSYAEKGKKILEPLCGSGRFLVPFLERGFTISGIDLSEEMLAKLWVERAGAVWAYGFILRQGAGGTSVPDRKRSGDTPGISWLGKKAFHAAAAS